MSHGMLRHTCVSHDYEDCQYRHIEICSYKVGKRQRRGVVKLLLFGSVERSKHSYFVPVQWRIVVNIKCKRVISEKRDNLGSAVW